MLKKLRKFFNRSLQSKEISYKDLQEFMRNNNAILIDVRSSQEYDEGHLNNAINIPLYNVKNEINENVKNKSNLIILYCSSGGRSKKAKAELEKMGYENVYNLKGGLDNIWIK